MAKDEHDLDYLSRRGYEEVPGAEADLSALRKRWNTAHPARKRMRGLLSGLAVFGALALLLFLLWNRGNSTSQVQAPSAPLQDSAARRNLQEVQVFPEKFVKPGGHLVHDSLIAGAPQSTLSIDTLQVLSLQGQTSRPDNPPGQAEEGIRFAFNSDVFYLQDLKITNYYTWYFKQQQALRLRGTPASEESNSNVSGMRLKEEAVVLLHEELARALGLFKAGRYAECQVLLSGISTYNSQDLNCAFYTGMCAFYRHRYSEAMQFFDTCLGSPNNTFWEESAFYRALALQASGDSEAARTALQKIREGGGFYAARAAEALQAR